MTRWFLSVQPLGGQSASSPHALVWRFVVGRVNSMMQPTLMQLLQLFSSRIRSLNQTYETSPKTKTCLARMKEPSVSVSRSCRRRQKKKKKRKKLYTRTYQVSWVFC